MTTVEWHPSDSSVFASGGEDNQIAIWDLSVERDNELSEDEIIVYIFVHYFYEISTRVIRTCVISYDFCAGNPTAVIIHSPWSRVRERITLASANTRSHNKYGPKWNQRFQDYQRLMWNGNAGVLFYSPFLLRIP